MSITRPRRIDGRRPIVTCQQQQNRNRHRCQGDPRCPMGSPTPELGAFADGWYQSGCSSEAPRNADEKPWLRRELQAERPGSATSAAKSERAGLRQIWLHHCWCRRRRHDRRWPRHQYRPSNRLCPPPVSGWPPWPPGTTGTGFWSARSSGLGESPAAPAGPDGAPPPPAAYGIRQRPRSAAGRGPAATVPPAGAVAPFVPSRTTRPRIGAAAGTLRRPPHRTGNLPAGGCAPWGRRADPTCVWYG